MQAVNNYEIVELSSVEEEGNTSQEISDNRVGVTLDQQRGTKKFIGMSNARIVDNYSINQTRYENEYQ